MGVVNPRNLQALMFALITYRNAHDPIQEINNYLVINNVLTPNIRDGQPDAWRDYQQVLADLGLMVSSSVQKKLTPTPLGLAYVDGIMDFSELMTLQALRYQYPNGQKEGLLEQITNGVFIRPCVLVWQVLRKLQQCGTDASLSISEIRSYLARCTTHADIYTCVDAIMEARRQGTQLPSIGKLRDFQEWLRFLYSTNLFVKSNNRFTIKISIEAQQNALEIDQVCSELEKVESFWLPRSFDEKTKEDRLDWFASYGQINLGLQSLPDFVIDSPVRSEQSNVDIDDHTTETKAVQKIQLRDFDQDTLRINARSQDDEDNTIIASYDAGLSDSKHRLHDLMVAHIANLCKSKGAKVYDDPSSVDLLIQYENMEWIVEVKSVTSRNFVKRLRYAIGQVLHYEYLREKDTGTINRKVIAVAAQIPTTSWCVPLINSHLDMDLLSFAGQKLRIDTASSLSAKLFSYG